MITATAVATTFGLKAEGWVIDLLEGAGYQVIRATEVDDKVRKVDFWVRSTEMLGCYSVFR